jgi:multicomponent Na+:H+ antiporter subunit D
MAGKNNLNRYYSFLLVSFTGCVGVAFAGNLLTQFLFFEIASLVPYILIIHDGKPHTITAANKYLYMCLMASLALFFSVVYTYFLTDTLEFAELKNLAKQGIVLPTSIFVSFILGYATKAGLFPLHIWLPDAYPVAPSPFGSLSSGIMIKVGIFGIFKLFFEIYDFNLINQLGWGTVLQVIAGITILLGSAMALNEKNLKKLLAYSSISQMGYILLGTSLLNNRALLGAVFHLFSHSFAKGTLFLCAGAIKQKTGNLNIDNMKGLGYKMPITMACFTISALSMIGIPPLSGFVSKWYLGLGCLDASMPLYLIILLVSSLMNAIYFLPITINAFFTSETQKKFTINEVPFKMLFSIVSLTFGTILGGVFRTPILILAKTAAKKLLI